MSHLHNSWTRQACLLSVEERTEIVARRDLYKLLDEGLEDIANGRTQEFCVAMKETIYN